ncbi:MAG: hypothetical protein RIA71_16065 [Oceanicaulis sp.]
MSGPKPHPEIDARKSTAPTTREEQLKSPEIRGDVPAGDRHTTGTAGGEIQKDIGTKDELEQQFEVEGEKTRVHKSEESTTPKQAGETDRPGELRNPDEKHGQRSKGSRHKG